MEIHVTQDVNASLKEIVKAIKESGSGVVTVDPLTGTFMGDGFASQGMPMIGRDRIHHTSAYEAFDLGFAKVFIDPSFSDNCVVIGDNKIDIVFDIKLF